jgi:glycosyltransferase involved in cell wall biosynthesis
VQPAGLILRCPTGSSQFGGAGLGPPQVVRVVGCVGGSRQRPGPKSHLGHSALKILQVISSVAERYGGPSVTVLGISKALQSAGHYVSVVSTDDDGPGRLASETSERFAREGVRLSLYKAHFPRRWKTSLGLAYALPGRAADADLLIIHSLYLFPTAVAALVARRMGKPYLVRPHGTLSPYFLTRHRRLKLAYEWLFDGRMITNATGVLCASEIEAAHVLARYPQARVLVAPLGVLPSREPAQMNRGRLIYLGRLSPVKGLDVLIDAVAELRRRGVVLRLDIAGPDEFGMRAELQAQIDAANLTRQVAFHGLVDGARKREFMAEGGIFVLPSASENFSMATAEALAYGLPTVVTPGLGLSSMIRDSAAGIVCERTASGLADAVQELQSESAYAATAWRALAFAQEKLNWKTLVCTVEAAAGLDSGRSGV